LEGLREVSPEDILAFGEKLLKITSQRLADEAKALLNGADEKYA